MIIQLVPALIDWTSNQLAEAFIQYIWRDKGLTDSIVSDQVSFFISEFRSAFCFYFHIKQKLMINLNVRIKPSNSTYGVIKIISKISHCHCLQELNLHIITLFIALTMKHCSI